MRVGAFLNQLDARRISDSIRAAESHTSAEIRVFVSSRRLRRREDIVSRASRRFEKLGMTSTRERNGVLIYFMPLEHQFAIIGDRGIDEKCGHGFWTDITADMEAALKGGSFTDAVTHAIHDAGMALSRHFPRRPDDRNELSDEIEVG